MDQGNSRMQWNNYSREYAYKMCVEHMNGEPTGLINGNRMHNVRKAQEKAESRSEFGELLKTNRSNISTTDCQPIQG